MITMTAGFTTEKNKKTGAAPVWILKCPFTSGTLYLSDRVVTYTGITIKPWIASWGRIDEDLTDKLTSPMVSDFSCDIIIDPDEATDIHDLLWSEAVETLNFELYLWFEGLTVATDPMILRWTGNIADFEKVNELLYKVDFVDQGVKWDKYPGRVLSLADYASASLDDVGYQMPILYGAITKSPALRLDIGKKTTLIATIDADDVDFYLSDGTGIANGTHIIIGGEEIEITTISANHITACDRGHNSTAAVAHSAGSIVIEKKAACVYLFADHPVKSIGNIYVLRSDGVPIDVTSVCTKYTGQGGANDLAGYVGKAVITCPGYITFAQAEALGLTDTIDASSVMDGDAEQKAVLLPTGLPVHMTEASGVVETGHFTPTLMGQTSTITKEWYEVDWYMQVTTNITSGDYIIYAQLYGTDVNLTTVLGHLLPAGWVPYAPTTAKIYGTGGTPLTNQADLHIRLLPGGSKDGGDFDIFINEIRECCLAPVAIDTTKTGTVSLTGNQYIDIFVGDNLLISGEGYQDDGDGTFTGTGSALIEQPDHIFKHFLYTYASLAVANFSTDAAASFAADSYIFSVVMNSRKKLREWCAYMALQCRCWFRFANSKAYLLYRPDSLSSDKTIAKFADNDDFTTTMQIRRSPLDEVLNKITVHYNRDWSKPEGREAYQAVITVSDATSIAAYGEKESPDTFLFDFVTGATMADDLADFYLARYKDRKKIITGDLFLDNWELEFADVVTLTEAGSLVCEVRKVGVSPGNGNEMDKIVITAREY